MVGKDTQTHPPSKFPDCCNRLLLVLSTRHRMTAFHRRCCLPLACATNSCNIPQVVGRVATLSRELRAANKATLQTAVRQTSTSPIWKRGVPQHQSRGRVPGVQYAYVPVRRSRAWPIQRPPRPPPSSRPVAASLERSPCNERFQEQKDKKTTIICCMHRETSLLCDRKRRCASLENIQHLHLYAAVLPVSACLPYLYLLASLIPLSLDPSRPFSL